MKRKQILHCAILCLFLISTPIMIKAQTKKGDWLAEGNLGNINLSNNNNESTLGTYVNRSENQSFYISLYPRIGYFINENFVIGTTLNYSYSLNNLSVYYENGIRSYEAKYVRSSIGLSPFLRYYFTKNIKNRLYGQISGGMNVDISSNEEGTSFNEMGNINGSHKASTKGQLVFGEALIGFNHFFTNHLAFNSSIGYNYGRRIQNSTSNYTYGSSIEPPQESKSTNLTGNAIWNFGFTIIIEGKKAD